MIRLRRHTVRRHVVVWWIALSALSMLAVLGGYAVAQRTLERELDTRMEARAAELRSTAAAGGTPALLRSLQEYDGRGLRGFSYRLAGADGNTLFGPRDLPPLDAGWQNLHMVDLDDDAVEEGRVLTVAFPSGEKLSVVADTDYIRRFDRSILVALLVAFGGMCVLALAGALWLGRVIVGRLSAVNDTAAALAGLPDLDQRVPLSPRGDEFDAVAMTFNAMLDRIGGLLADNMRVTGYIAHDLRSPLVRLAERIADARLVEGDRRARLLDAAEDDITQVLELFDAFLAVGQHEAGVAQAAARFDLSALVGELADSYAVVAASSGRALRRRIDAGAIVEGNEGLIAQLIVNLIENAVRHTPGRAEITLLLTRSDTHAHLIVSDDARRRADTAAPPGRRPKGDRQRLGLKLIESVARSHGGSFSSVDGADGNIGQVVLPLAPHASQG